MNTTIEDLKALLASEKLAKINLKDVVDGFIHGKTYMQIFGISDSLMQEFYEASLEYLDNGQYTQAADCFLFLCALNPLAPNLWIQAGIAEACCLRHNEALEAYSMAMICDPDDPFPHIYSALIYIDKGDKDLASQCLQVATQLIEEEPSFHHLREQVVHLQKSIWGNCDETV